MAIKDSTSVSRTRDHIFSPQRRKTLQIFGRFLRLITTLPARIRLSKRRPLRVLVDSSIRFHAVTHETAWIATGKSNWGNLPIETGFAARVPIHGVDCTSKSYTQIRYLAGIAHLARLGYVQLFTSAELGAEQFRQPTGRYSGYGYDDLNLFSDLSIPTIDGHVIDFENPKAKQLERVKKCTDPVFQSLVSVFGEKNSLDAYHVFTAVHFGMTCLLHLDFKLAENILRWRRQNSNLQLGTKVCLPQELGEEISLLPLDPRFLSWEGASFFVRPDLTSPDQKRRRPRKQ